MSKKQLELYPHQRKAVDKLRTGSVLCGGVGSGKSLTALEYYSKKVQPWLNLYIITTAKKRDTGDWEKECKNYTFNTVVVDSWNNIKKYVDVTEAFFIFDEQRVIGSGAWVKSFLKITKKNEWILLTATPGDTWMDYIPIFLANKFYRNRTHFITRHVIFNRFVAYPKVDRYLEEAYLEKLKQYVTVTMDYKKTAERIYENIPVSYNLEELERIRTERWDTYNDKPIKNAAGMVHLARRIVNSHPSRIGTVQALLDIHQRLVVFYNFNYELEILKELSRYPDITVAEYNGHKHQPIPKEQSKWVYLVQYLAGNEGWNCVETNVIVFFSLNYSYRIMTQAAGRIDRINTPFSTLFYYRLISDSLIDKSIQQALSNKKNFNESRFARETYTIIEEDH